MRHHGAPPLTAWMAVVSAIGCGVLASSGVRAAEPADLPSALVLSGFGVEWEKRPHRVRVLGFGARADGTGVPEGTLWTDVQGGTWADGATARDVPKQTLLYAGLASSARRLVSGTTTVEVRGDRREAGEGVATVRVPLETPSGALWLRGFRVESGEEHPVGYTLHALGVQLGALQPVEGGVEFEVRVQLHASGVPDRLQQLKDYGARFEVDWLVVPADASRVRVHTQSSDRKTGVGLAEGEDGVPVSRVDFDWEVEAGDVVAGLTGFHVDVANEGPVDGRYWRSLDVQLVTSAYDPYRARWSGQLDLRFANGGPITRRLGVQVGAVVTTLALDAGERTWTGRWTPAVQKPGPMEAPYP
ncbi:MAG: hypothetical protein R3F61_12655 [Myxococcota bacterium]